MNISKEINNLPKHIRDYIHELESVTPADLVQEVMNLREKQKALIRRIKLSDTTLRNCLKCGHETDCIEGICLPCRLKADEQEKETKKS